MSKFNLAVNSFLSGELSPKMYGRSDLPQYFQGAEELYNQLVYAQGGTYRRPGSAFINVTNGTISASTADWSAIVAASYARSIPYTTSDGQKFLIVMTPGVISNPAAKWVYIDLSTNIAYPIWNLVASVTRGSKDFTQAEIENAQVAYAGDFLIMTFGTKAPIFFYLSTPGNRYYSGVTGLVANPWDQVEPIYSSAYPYRAKFEAFLPPNIENNQNQGTITSSAATGAVTLTSSGFIFRAGHVGALFKLSSAGSTGYARVTSYTNSGSVQASVELSVPTVACGSTAGTSWEESAWSDARGWPRAVCAYGQRVVYGGTASQPDYCWASQTGDIFELMARRFEQDPDFADAVTDDRPFSFPVSSTEVSTVQWLASGKSLIVGTLGREIVITGSFGALLGFSLEPQSAYGSTRVQPVRYDSALYFCQRSGQSIRELVFNLDEDAYKGNNILALSEHLPRKSATKHATFSTPKIMNIAIQMTENPILWAIDNNGGLMSCTVDRTNQIVAWAYHEMGGSLSSEPPKVFSIAPVVSADGTSDDLYLLVRRTVNGTTKFFLERIGREFGLEAVFNSSTNIHDKLLQADCAALKILGAPGTAFSGFSHLANESVDVVADGHYLGRYTVSGAGVITLASNYTEVVAGLPYTSRVKLLDLVPPSPVGSSVGQQKKVNHLTVKFYRTISAKFGKALSDLEAITFRDSSLAASTPTPLFTGDKRLTLHPGYERATSIYIVQDQALPMSISCVVADGNTNA